MYSKKLLPFITLVIIILLIVATLLILTIIGTKFLLNLENVVLSQYNKDDVQNDI